MFLAQLGCSNPFHHNSQYKNKSAHFKKKKINNLLYGACRQSMVATFVTTYKRTKLHEKERERKEKERKRNKINTWKKIILLSHKMKMHLDSTPKT